jgi:hypothetical protein
MHHDVFLVMSDLEASADKHVTFLFKGLDKRTTGPSPETAKVAAYTPYLGYTRLYSRTLLIGNCCLAVPP